MGKVLQFDSKVNLIFYFLYSIFFNYFIRIYYSGKCSLNTVSDLEEGYSLIKKHGKKADFMKAVREMAYTIKENNSNKSNVFKNSVFKNYIQLLS